MKLLKLNCCNLIFLLLIYFNNIPKNMKTKITIFLPIYNQEKNIRTCIQSIQRQTLKNIEIVAVNDHSRDNSLQIIKDLAQHDSRIKIVNNDNNHGLLYSRAMGILNSSGEYIMNLDPDDMLGDKESLEYLYNRAKYLNIDTIVFDLYNENEKKTIKCEKNKIIQKQPELFDSIFAENNLIKDYLIVNKLIKKNIFLKALYDFRNEIYNFKWNFFEDDIWSILVNKHSKSKLCINRLVYIYKYNSDSLMHNRFNILEFKNLLYRHEKYKNLFSNKKEEKYLIAEYFFLLNRLKCEIKYLLLIEDNNIKKQIMNIFHDLLNKYNCNENQRQDINNFLKLIIV